ncbi:adenylate kinase 8-like [Anneissia japonica]|uniref:adenylate kinase 8-like n=1 Tax=Anneissia japonica TaxID=1529436 RepID=UPI0014256A0E|nr:adenylate kinase 8-like [Anneissia japonica]
MDATKRPLRIPPQFATYAQKHELFELYRRLISRLLIDKPDDPLNFILEELKREDDDVPAIIIQGPPASGKTTIGKMVSSKLRTAHITQQLLLEDDVSPLAAKARAIIDKKESVPMDLWVKLIQARLKLFDCVKKGWVMEGFPVNRGQALALQEVGIAPKHYVILEAPDTVLIERQMGKRVDPETQDVYHTTFDYPSNPEVEKRLIEPPEGCTEDEMTERLVLYHRHADGLKQCYQKFAKTINADQPKADVFSQVMTALSTKHRSLAPHTPRIVLLGPTGSGKSVQAALLASKYNIISVSSGQLVKEAIANESKIGEAIKPYVNRNMPIPDNLILKLLEDRLSQIDCVTSGWVLRGFPRTREQAENLSTAGYEPNRVFCLDVPNDSVYERLTLRMADPVTGIMYHTLYNPPHSSHIKDRCQRHPDDSDEAVQQRLSAYNAYIEELTDFYKRAQHINADQDPHTVFECIESMLVNQLPSNLDRD